MACRLFGAKPLPEAMLAFCQLDSWKQISVTIESEFYHFQLRKRISKCCLPEWQPFCPGGDELKAVTLDLAARLNIDTDDTRKGIKDPGCWKSSLSMIVLN